MSKKILGVCAPLLAIAALAAPGAAQAAPQWLSNGVPIPEGMIEPVETTGSLTFTIHFPAAEVKIKCKVVDEEQVVNLHEGLAGEDTTLAFLPMNCKSKNLCPKKQVAEVIALNLPWHSHLLAGPPIRDAIEGIVLEVRCSGAFVDLFGPGTLLPVVSPKSRLEFDAGSGVLEDPSKIPMSVTGKDKLKGPPGDEKVTAA